MGNSTEQKTATQLDHITAAIEQLIAHDQQQKSIAKTHWQKIAALTTAVQQQIDQSNPANDIKFYSSTKQLISQYIFAQDSKTLCQLFHATKLEDKLQTLIAKIRTIVHNYLKNINLFTNHTPIAQTISKNSNSVNHVEQLLRDAVELHDEITELAITTQQQLNNSPMNNQECKQPQKLKTLYQQLMRSYALDTAQLLANEEIIYAQRHLETLRPQN